MDRTSMTPPPATVPFGADNDNPNHPPYDEMIYTAIGALKEKDGSSKRAIGKYIEQVYKDLPPTHSALLTHHLNRLKSAGHLQMVKKSYKLPGSEPTQTQRSRGRPPKQPKPTSLSGKRSRGRPKKIGAVSPAATARSKLPKSPGRPPKPKSVSAISTALKVKRRPGRPPKAQPLLPTPSHRSRGRPKKTLPSVSPLPLPLPLSSFSAAPPPPPPPPPPPRPRGRPRTLLSVIRPHKLAVVRPKNPSTRPVGRPKGATAAAITAHKAANEDLRKKLEHFQSKVKESLGVLKPFFNHESSVTAIAAIQDLEVLSTLDLKAPLRDEPPPQHPAQQQPQPETQVYEQQYHQIPPQLQLQQFFQPHTSAPS
ncbi:hypothetical protein VNO78_09981 [Psophocarpus tetragonolobus]|uniref:H15 domain-containing protein n=1 Tax=Psophocarpus tetragonolobus TaxID=3891 RepID=A0AAN9SK11_PSOTE